MVFLLRSLGEIDQRQPGGLIRPAPERLGRLDDDHLERRSHVGFEQMAAQRCSIGFRHDGVGVQLRLPLVKGDIARERDDLYLLFDRDPYVVFAVDVEEAERGSAECTDGREVSTRQPLANCDAGELGHGLFALTEDHHDGLLPLRFLQNPQLHGARLPAGASSPHRVSKVKAYILHRPCRGALWPGLGGKSSGSAGSRWVGTTTGAKSGVVLTRYQCSPAAQPYDQARPVAVGRGPPRGPGFSRALSP